MFYLTNLLLQILQIYAYCFFLMPATFYFIFLKNGETSNKTLESCGMIHESPVLNISLVNCNYSQVMGYERVIFKRVCRGFSLHHKGFIKAKVCFEIIKFCFYLGFTKLPKSGITAVQFILKIHTNNGK